MVKMTNYSNISYHIRKSCHAQEEAEGRVKHDYCISVAWLTLCQTVSLACPFLRLSICELLRVR